VYATLLFWLALALPGFAAIYRFDRKQLNAGLLGTLALSYLATFALLSPVSILCYLLELPLAVLSGACVLLVLAGLLEIIRQRAWREAASLLLGAFSVELLVVVGDMFLGARVGSIVGADAVTHIARIRFLTDHGLTNADPFVAGDHFFPLYHTNLLHALCAACAQLTGVDHFRVWFSSLPWAKLVVAGGAYYMAWSVFRRPWPAWVATVFVVAAQGPITFLIYPNKLAPLWLLVLVVGLTIRAFVAPTWKSVVWIAAAALVVAQIHALYGGFAIVLLGPVLAVGILASLRHRRRRSVRLAFCCLALAVSLPFAWAAKAGRATDQDSPGPKRVTSPERAASSFTKVGDASYMKHPLRGFGGGNGWRYSWLAGGVMFGLIGQRRREVGLLLTTIMVATAIFFTPPLCTAALSVLGAKWILLRMEIAYFIAFPILVPASIVYAFARLRPRYWICCAVSVLVFALAIPYATHPSGYNWSRYGRLARLPRSQRLGNVSRLRDLRQMLQAQLPAGATVLAEPSLGMRLVAAYDCRLVAPASGSVGVRHIGRRRADARLMLWGGDGEERERLLQRHGIRYLFATKLPRWAIGRTQLLGRSSYGKLWLLGEPDPDEDATRRVPETPTTGSASSEDRDGELAVIQ
jgi:hypothetical protein